MRASRAFLLASFGLGIGYAMFWTLALLFQDQVAHLQPFQLVILGTVAEITIFLGEIPTGILADNYSRRFSVLVGFALIGVGFLIQPIGVKFPVLVLGMILWGLGETFKSGAFEAWIADELPHEPGAPPAEQMFLRGGQASMAGYLLGSWIAIAVGKYGKDLGLPLLLSGVVFLVLSLTLAFVMPEKGFVRAPKQERMTWPRLRQTFHSGFGLARSRPMYLYAVSVTFFIGLGSEAFDRLWNKRLTEIGLPSVGRMDPLAWFGIAATVAILFALLVLGALRKRGFEHDRQRVVYAAATFNGLLVLAVLGFALAQNFYLALGCVVAGRTIRKCLDPIMTSWVNAYAESDVRATMISMHNQMHGFGEMIGGPMLGAVAQFAGIPAALVGSAVCNLGSFFGCWAGTKTLAAPGVVPEPEG